MSEADGAAGMGAEQTGERRRHRAERRARRFLFSSTLRNKAEQWRHGSLRGLAFYRGQK
jgi:hypothetical protein